MKLFATIIPFREYKKVKYYTVQLSNESLPEVERFFETGLMWTDVKVLGKLADLKVWIVEIGDNRGAQAQLFRPERNARALPPPPEFLSRAQRVRSGKNVRLYCLRLSDEVIILFNGGLKTNNDPTKCPNVRDHFYNAISWSNQILRLQLKLNGKEIDGINSVSLKS